MKVYYNEYSTKIVSVLRKPNINKKEDISIKNNSDTSFPKIKIIKNLKKNINDKFNSIKNERNNIKKSFDSKNALKIIKSNPNNQKTIIAQNNSRKGIGLIHKSKITQKHSKNNSTNIINIHNYITNDNKNNSKKHINSIKYNSNDNKNKHKNKIINKSFINNKPDDVKEEKLINSLSTSSVGLNVGNKEKQYVPFKDSENNNHKHNYNIDSQSVEKNNILIEENKENINNFCYETGTKDESNENKVILKCDNNSLLTFGNSFSYSNSHKSKSTKKLFNNDNNDKESININNNDKNNNSLFNLTGHYNMKNNIVNKLKEENETLRKELKESNEQINLLMCQIKELKEGINYKPNKITKKKMGPTNLWNKKQINLEDNDKENYNIWNINETGQITLYNKSHVKVNIKKNILKYRNSNNNINNYNGNKLKVNKIKINKNLITDNKKGKKKINNTSINDKPCEKINECISKIKI